MLLGNQCPHWWALVVAPVFCASTACPAAEPLLPDLFSLASESQEYMYGGEFDTTTIPGKVLYRFNAAIPNIGAGPLEVREETHGSVSQDVYQRIYDSEGGVSESLLGTFPDPAPTFGHLWLVGLAQYNLREVTSAGGVGPIVSSHDKTSMGILDGVAYDTSLPGAPATPVYQSGLDPLLGISVGWADLYNLFLPGQWVEATGLPDGFYWLEVVIDPYGRVQESDKSNNTTRILVDLVVPEPQNNIPEPSAWCLAVAGLLSFAAATRRVI